MQNITSQKFAEMCNCTATNIRNLRASGTLVAQQDEKGNWLFDLDLEENRAYYNKNKKVSQPVEQVVAEASQFVSQADGQGVTQSLCTSIEKLTQQLEKSNEHALLAGKALMLESNISKLSLYIFLLSLHFVGGVLVPFFLVWGQISFFELMI